MLPPPANAFRFKMSPLVFWRRYQVAVNDAGVWRLPQGGEPVFIGWRDVATVRADDTMQRLILADRTGAKSIRLDYQLSHFTVLRDHILRQTTEDSRSGAGKPSVFHKTWINKIVILALCAVLFVGVLFVGAKTTASQRPPFYVIALIYLSAGVFVLARDPLSLAITPGAVVIRYPGWRRVIPLDDIASVTLSDESNRGNVWAVVAIGLRRGKAVKLYRFREGSLALLSALQRALKRQTSG